MINPNTLRHERTACLCVAVASEGVLREGMNNTASRTKACHCEYVSVAMEKTCKENVLETANIHKARTNLCLSGHTVATLSEGESLENSQGEQRPVTVNTRQTLKERLPILASLTADPLGELEMY